MIIPPSSQQHLNTYAINLQTADLSLCITSLLLPQCFPCALPGACDSNMTPGKHDTPTSVTRKFYKVTGLQLVSCLHKYSEAVEMMGHKNYIYGSWGYPLTKYKQLHVLHDTHWVA